MENQRSSPPTPFLERIEPSEGWATLLLPWGMLIVVALIVAEADLARDYNMRNLLLIAGSVGALSGFTLAKSRFPGFTAHIYALIYALFTITILVGRIMPAAETLIWRERVAELVLLIVEWVQQVVNGGTNREVLIWVMYTTAIFWLLGYTMMWFTFRNNRVWRVVLPGALVSLSVIYYYFGPQPLGLYLALYCLLALLYIAQTHLVNYKQAWQARNVRYESGLSGLFMRNTLLVGAVVMAVAWSLPAMTASASVMDTVGQVNQPWRQFRDSWQRLFAALDSSYSQGISDVYSESLELGGPRNPGDFPIMDVWVDEKLPFAYWRAQVLHTYDGEWHELDGETFAHFPDDGLIDVPETQGRTEVTQRFINYVPDAGTIYGAPDMVSADKQLLVRGTINPTGDTEVSNVRSRFVLQQGDQYEVVSRLSTADATSLRRSATNYPPYILETYLQVPDSVTPETVALAEEIAGRYDNPFDKAIAIRDWLRTNITYNDQVNWPPDDVDPVHYMLFETREGFCNYYASAMALMLRSQGVPTRVARGFAAGEFIEETNTYRVRAKDAHTWPEVYFSGYGWIQLEPTVIIPTVARAEGEGGDNFSSPEPQTNLADQEESFPEEVNEPSPEELAALRQNPGESTDSAENALPAWLTRLNPWQVGGALFVVVAALVAVLLARRLNRQVEGDLLKSYGRLAVWGRWLGLEITPQQTPFERANLLTEVAPAGARPIKRLVGEYVERTFSPWKEDNSFFNSLAEWQILRPILLRETLKRRRPRLRRPAPELPQEEPDRIPTWLKKRGK